MNLDRNETGEGRGEREAPPQRWGGSADAGRGEERVPARFAWLDEETGEELLVDFVGSECFFRELERLGFERRAHDGDADEDAGPWRRERGSRMTVLRATTRRPA